MNIHKTTMPVETPELSNPPTVRTAARVPPTKVLVIDEDRETTGEMAAAVIAAGYLCDLAGGPLEALDAVRADRTISIVVAILNSPAANDLEMIRSLQDGRAVGGEVAVIVVSESGDDAQAVEALHRGAMDCLFKPVAPECLAHAIARADETLKLRRLEHEFSEMLARKVAERTIEERRHSDDLARSNLQLQVRNRSLSVSNRINSEFLCLIDQELRAPLNTVIGFSEIMAANNEENGDDRELEFSHHICQAGGELLRIVDSIHDMTNVCRGDAELPRVDVDIVAIVENMVKIMAPRAAAACIALATNVADMLPVVRGDAKRLLRVICNVVDNAIRFSPPDTLVRIDVETAGHRLCIRISDQGTGMTEEEIRVAGEGFRQSGDGVSNKIHGRGLGLPLSRMFTEQHRGKLNIESSLGIGTTVTITIPVAIPSGGR
ncbi:MAG: ATP-binding protein [Alphaproteobacteria bacterium]